MKSKYSHLPLKAYEVYEKGDDWRCLSKEYSYGILVGHTAGQARAQVATDRMSGGYTNPWPYLRTRRVLGLAAERAIEAHEDRGKYWRYTKAYARIQAEAEAFNRKWPVGTPVQILNCCESDLWPDGVTITRTPAWAPSETYAFVSVEGMPGGMNLACVFPLVEPITV